MEVAHNVVEIMRAIAQLPSFVDTLMVSGSRVKGATIIAWRPITLPQLGAVEELDQHIIGGTAQEPWVAIVCAYVGRPQRDWSQDGGQKSQKLLETEKSKKSHYIRQTTTFTMNEC